MAMELRCCNQAMCICFRSGSCAGCADISVCWDVGLVPPALFFGNRGGGGSMRFSCPEPMTAAGEMGDTCIMEGDIGESFLLFEEVVPKKECATGPPETSAAAMEDKLEEDDDAVRGGARTDDVPGDAPPPPPFPV